MVRIKVQQVMTKTVLVNRWRILFLCAVLLVLVSWYVARFTRTYISYDFKPQSTVFPSGTLVCMLVGDYENYDSSATRATIRGNPYYLLIRFTTQIPGVDKITLSSVKLSGVKSSQSIYLSDVDNKKFVVHKAGSRVSSFLFEHIVIDYDDIEVSGVVEIALNDGQIRKEAFSVLLKRFFKIERSNDILDMLMSA